jgi:hypothetical protein
VSSHDQQPEPIHVLADWLTVLLFGTAKFVHSSCCHIGLTEDFEQFLTELEIPQLLKRSHFSEVWLCDSVQHESDVHVWLETTDFEVVLHLYDPFGDFCSGSAREPFNVTAHVASRRVLLRSS